jgi:archaellum component FlaC
MSFLDWTANGTIADEALWISAMGGILATVLTIRFRQGKISSNIQRIDDTLNHVGEPEPDSGPTLGQRVAKIDRHVDQLDQKIDGLHEDVRSLSRSMLAHITDEGRRMERLEVQVSDISKTVEAIDEQGCKS